MAFHLRTELPQVEVKTLNESLPTLTEEEVRILRHQIKRNSEQIQQDVKRLELYLIHERYPKDTTFLDKIRDRMKVSMEENDTFRKVLWKQCQAADAVPVVGSKPHVS